MAWYPGAIRKRIAKHNQRRTSLRNRMNLHVAVSEASSLYGFFSGAGVCSHFYIRKDGTVEQYIDTDYFSAADYQGNDATISVETQGGVHNAQGEPWTDAQLAALVSLWVWVSQEHDIPLRLAEDSRIGASSKGLSWHRLGIDPWRVGGGMYYSKSRGKICPGDAKIAQIGSINERASGTTPVSTPVQTPAPTPAPVGNGGGVKNWLERGDSGQAVKDVQTKLKALGYYKGAIDGLFGPMTLAAVRSFQAAAHLVIDGLVGPATQAALAKATAPAPAPIPAGAVSQTVLKRGDRGEAVRILQRTLNKNYPAYSRLTVDGLFGPATEAVVREFQRRAGLVVDGLVGPKTQAKLGI